MEFMENDSQIVIVDDEEIVLEAISSLLDLTTDYRVNSFLSPAEALAFAENAQVDLVMADYLMPRMDGISLLSAFRDRHPQAPRILLTGYADKENAIKAINEVGLFQYIEKPWDNENLLIVLRNALERRFLFKSLQEKIAEIDATHGQLEGLQRDILRTFI